MKTARWRVVRLSSSGNGSDVCRHRFEWVAWWCARRYEKRTEIGVFFTVRPVAEPVDADDAEAVEAS